MRFVVATGPATISGHGPERLPWEYSPCSCLSSSSCGPVSGSFIHKPPAFRIAPSQPSANTQWTPAGRELFAAVQCPDHIERLAQYGVRWTDGVLEPKFPRSGWQDAENYLAVYMGDAVEFQNAFGAWQRHRYSCVVNVRTEQVVDVAALPSRLQ